MWVRSAVLAVGGHGSFFEAGVLVLGSVRGIPDEVKPSVTELVTVFGLSFTAGVGCVLALGAVMVSYQAATRATDEI